MKKIRNPFINLNIFEWILWIFSLATIISAFFAVGSTDYAKLATSLLGVTALIFAAKGDAYSSDSFMVVSVRAGYRLFIACGNFRYIFNQRFIHLYMLD